MIRKFAEGIILSMERKDYIKENAEIYQYGLELVLSYSLSVMGIISYAVLQKAIFEAIIFIVLFGNLRKYAGGYHAKSFLGCNLSFILLFVLYLSLLQLHYIPISFIILSMAILIMACPIEHINKPISKNERNICRKKLWYYLLYCSIIMILFMTLEWIYFVNIIAIVIIYTALLSILGLIINRKEVRK